MRINWKETISINKYAWMFLNILIYIILAYSIYSFIFQKQKAEERDKQILKNQKKAEERDKQILKNQKELIEGQKRTSEERKRANERLDRIEERECKERCG